jgi:phosphatidylglycerol:prolipoprotein diacylglycerol transferase
MGTIPTLAYIIDWGWVRIGPPYIYINMDPVFLHIGPLHLTWYGLMYVVAIIMGLLIIRGYTRRMGISNDIKYRVLWWCIVAGLIGGRLYFVIQQPNFVSFYLTNPQHILATWEGGMAFFGAIFLVIPVLFWRAKVERVNPLVAIDAGVLFAAGAQIFGRIGNIINGDIIGYPSTLPWSTVYQNPNSYACLNPATCNVPVQPAALYELLANIALLVILLFLSHRLRRPGVLMLVYLFGYVTTQFLLFFVRDNVVVSFLGLNWGLKQAQWTSLIVFILLIPLTFLVLRFSKPVPEGEVPATYGIAQKPKPDTQKPAAEEEIGEESEERSETPEVEQSSAEDAEVVEDKQPESEETEEKIEK